MAEKRMFSKAITCSARFLRMPPTSRLLYFDLGMAADDDGIVEAYPVMKMTGATEDDLRVLVARQFVTLLNEDLVTYIDDWLINNNLRADRKKDSLYQPLLLQVRPDIKLLESKERADRKSNGTSRGQPMDDLVKCSTGEDKLDKISLGKDRVHDVEKAFSTGLPTDLSPTRMLYDTSQIRGAIGYYTIAFGEAPQDVIEAFAKSGLSNQEIVAYIKECRKTHQEDIHEYIVRTLQSRER